MRIQLRRQSGSVREGLFCMNMNKIFHISIGSTDGDMNIIIYGRENWTLTQRNEKILYALEREFWSKSNQASTLAHKRNSTIRRQLKEEQTMIDHIEE